MVDLVSRDLGYSDSSEEGMDVIGHPAVGGAEERLEDSIPQDIESDLCKVQVGESLLSGVLALS